MSRYCVVASEQHITLPLAMENSLYPAGLVSTVVIDLPPTRRRPADDLNLNVIRILHQAAVTADAVISRDNQGNLVQRQSRLVSRIKKILGSCCHHRISACGRAGASGRRYGQARRAAHADI